MENKLQEKFSRKNEIIFFAFAKLSSSISSKIPLIEQKSIEFVPDPVTPIFRLEI